ncbi:MAG TPA: hypothetical protein VG326_09815 [Tepidisphaeraceae bacterium]|nr:hypothetical protein [Tepidisphaeraceae bacterium]
MTIPTTGPFDVTGFVSVYPTPTPGLPEFNVISISTSSSLTPTVTVASGNSVYNRSGYVPSATVSGSQGVDSGATVTYTYYAGVGGTNLGSTAPIGAGTYTVVANFAGDSTYLAGSSSPTP